MPEMVVNTNVAYRKIFSSECTAGPSTTCASTTKKTAPIWQTVLILPKMLGRKSRKPTVAYSTMQVATISTSRPSTATVPPLPPPAADPAKEFPNYASVRAAIAKNFPLRKDWMPEEVG